MQQLDPDVRLVQPLLPGVAEQGLHLRADEQRPPLVVRVHLVDDGRHLFDEHAVASFRRAEAVLGTFAIGQVLDQSLPVHRGAVAVADQDRGFADEHHLAVATEQAEITEERVAVPNRLDPRARDPVTVVGMHDPEEQRGVVLELLRSIPEHLRGLRAHVVADRRLFVRVDEHDRGDLLDERPVAPLGLAHHLLGAFRVGDVLDQPLPEQGHAVVRPHQARAVVEPRDAPVTVYRPILDRERRAASDGRHPFLAEALPVVGVRRVQPEASGPSSIRPPCSRSARRPAGSRTSARDPARSCRCRRSPAPAPPACGTEPPTRDARLPPGAAPSHRASRLARTTACRRRRARAEPRR